MHGLSYHPGVQRLPLSQHAGDAVSSPEHVRDREEKNDGTHSLNWSSLHDPGLSCSDVWDEFLQAVTRASVRRMRHSRTSRVIRPSKYRPNHWERGRNGSYQIIYVTQWIKTFSNQQVSCILYNSNVQKYPNIIALYKQI